MAGEVINFTELVVIIVDVVEEVTLKVLIVFRSFATTVLPWSRSFIRINNCPKTYSKEEIRHSEWYYVQKLDYLRINNCPQEPIWKAEDRLNLLIYKEERRTHLQLEESFDLNNDKDLDQFDAEYWFNDEG